MAGLAGLGALTATQTGLLVGASAIGGTALSAMQASSQNSAISRSMDAAKLAARAQQKQISQQAGLEQKKNLQRTQQLQGRLRVAFADSGVGFGGSYQAITQQNNVDYSLNRNLISQNFGANMARSQSELTATMLSLDSQKQNVLLQAFTGGLQGLSTGLTLTSGLNSLGQGGITQQTVDDLERGIGPSIGSIGGGGPNGLPSYGGSAFA